MLVSSFFLPYVCKRTEKGRVHFPDEGTDHGEKRVGTGLVLHWLKEGHSQDVMCRKRLAAVRLKEGCSQGGTCWKGWQAVSRARTGRIWAGACRAPLGEGSSQDVTCLQRFREAPQDPGLRCGNVTCAQGFAGRHHRTLHHVAGIELKKHLHGARRTLPPSQVISYSTATVYIKNIYDKGRGRAPYLSCLHLVLSTSNPISWY